MAEAGYALLAIAPLLLVIALFARIAFETDRADEERAKREGRELW